MANVSQLGSFPNTIRNLDDRPNLSAYEKKRAKEYLDSLPISAPVYDYIWTAVFGYKSR